MRVAVYYNNKDIRVEERPVPVIGDKEILVRVQSSGVCGSDVMEWYRIKTAPRVLGHEIAGVVERAGAQVRRFKKGDRVFVTHHVPCNTCRFCLKGLQTACETLHSTNFDPGGYAEFLRVPEIIVDRGTLILPGSVSFDEATFIEPLACGVRGLRLARFQPGESALVLGCGAAGILCVALAKALGAGRIMAADIEPFRRELAAKFGAEDSFDPRRDLASNVVRVNGHPAEFVIVATGAPQAFAQALACADKGGKILFFAPSKPGNEMLLPLFDFWNSGVTLTSSYGAAGADLTESLELIRSKRVPVNKMITHRLSLAEAPRAFELVIEAKKSLKVILRPHT